MTSIYIAVLTGVVLLLIKSVDCQCLDGDIRYDPEYADRMIIQVCSDNFWGYICGHESVFNRQDVAVTCNQLGYKTDDDYVAANFSKKLDGVLSYRTLYCTGLENRLADCANHNTYGTTSFCNRQGTFYYAAVNCSYEEILCINGDIQEDDNGNFQVCILGDWYYVCGDGWNDQDAQTVCRNLGGNPEGARGLLRAIDNNIDQVYNIRFHCTGEEKQLSDCQRSLLTKCDTNAIAVALCGDTPEQLSSISLFPLSNSQLMIEWNAGSHNNQLYHVSCTSINTSSMQTFTYQSQTISNSLILSDLADNITYNCCIATLLNQDIAGNPVCGAVHIPEQQLKVEQTFFPSCSISIASTQSEYVPSTDTETSVSSTSATAVHILQTYGPWLYGFVVGLVVGLVFMSLTCGCVLIVCKWKHQKRTVGRGTKNDGYLIANINTLPQEQQKINNPLYTIENPGLYAPSEKEKSDLKDEYAYVNQRPPAEIPIAPYHTVLAKEERYSIANNH